MILLEFKRHIQIIKESYQNSGFPLNSGPTVTGCTCLIRFHGLTMEDLSYLVLGPLNEMGPNLQGLKSYGIADLLIKCTEQGKEGVTSGAVRDRGGGGRPG